MISHACKFVNDESFKKYLQNPGFNRWKVKNKQQSPYEKARNTQAKVKDAKTGNEGKTELFVLEESYFFLLKRSSSSPQSQSVYSKGIIRV